MENKQQMYKNLRNKKYSFVNNCEDKGINDPYQIIIDMYHNEKKSCTEISEWFKETHNISVTPKYMSQVAVYGGDLRTKSEARILAIKSGRMIYKKKSKEELYIAKKVQSSTRTAILKRDNHRCQICHNGPHTNYSIEIHHKNPDSNNPDDLQTLCWLCHKGLHDTEKENTNNTQ